MFHRPPSASAASTTAKSGERYLTSVGESLVRVGASESGGVGGDGDASRNFGWRRGRRRCRDATGGGGSAAGPNAAPLKVEFRKLNGVSSKRSCHRAEAPEYLFQ